MDDLQRDEWWEVSWYREGRPGPLVETFFVEDRALRRVRRLAEDEGNFRVYLTRCEVVDFAQQAD